MLRHPSVFKVMLAPQYSQVMIISPRAGLSGAPQLGHFRTWASAAATKGLLSAFTASSELPFEFPDSLLSLKPHLGQKIASSGIWLPHFSQYIPSPHSCFPQFGQNLVPAGDSVPQFGHLTI